MSSPDVQERLKEEAKNISLRIENLVKDMPPEKRIIKTLLIYAGMMTETLLEYEEPDAVMEQAFHRIADLLKAEPEDAPPEDDLMPHAIALDHDAELGRALARTFSKKMSKGLDDIHEISIALLIVDVPVWEKEGYPREKILRLLIESVIATLTNEMAAQDFCDLLVETFIPNGHSTTDALIGISALAGDYFSEAVSQKPAYAALDKDFTNVMVREAFRHGTPGTKNWAQLAASNDFHSIEVSGHVAELKPLTEEFFVLIGLEDPLGKAVAVAKTGGRMVAVTSVEDVGHIHPSIAKSLAKTGMILGTQKKEQAAV